MADADIINAIVTLLKADADVAALCQGRVFGGELPAEETRSMPRAALVVRPSGGVSLAAGSFIEHDTQRFDILAYSTTARDANTLCRTARTVLIRVRRRVIAQCLIHWIERAGGFSAARDSDGQWPFAFQSFQVFHALQEV